MLSPRQSGRGLVQRVAGEDDHVIIIGAGIGGLTSAALLASQGLQVTVLEKESHTGGKIRRIPVLGQPVDAGPTVFTLKRVFDDIFDECGADLDKEVGMAPLETLARHAWPDGSRLDLFHDKAASRDAIGTFAGPADAGGYEAFAAESAAIWHTLEDSFVRRPKVGPIGLTMRLGLSRLAELSAVRPYESYWSALKGHFRDPRLVQLFGRYATYCGCSPFRAPATLMLIAHVESAGVWRVEGGLHRLASALASLVERRGGQVRTGATVQKILLDRGRAAGVELAGGERLRARRIIANCDPSALANGLFGEEARRAVRGTPVAARSLSSLTWMLSAEANGFPLEHHNVFFSNDYAREFADIAAGRLPSQPTAYICVQDQAPNPAGAARMQIIVNAPAQADTRPLSLQEIEQCESTMLNSLRCSGLSLRWKTGGRARVTPTDYANLFPSTGGALYGRVSHGALGSFLRPGSRTRIPGLYLAGGGTHPGAGVPMAAISGRLASEAVLKDLKKASVPGSMARASMSKSPQPATPGGMSTPCPTTADLASPSLPS